MAVQAAGPDLAWPEGRPRVLVTESWLANAGDAALSIATDSLIRSVAPRAAVVHAAYQHDVLGTRLPSLNLAPPLEQLLGVPWAPRPATRDSGLAFIAEADLVIAQGGGYLVEAYSPRGRIAALAEISRAGFPLAMLGVTVERFNNASLRRDLAQILTSARLVSVRDPVSLAAVADLSGVEPVLGADLVVELFPRPAFDAPRRGIGVVLSAHHPDPEWREPLADTAASILRYVVDYAGAEGEPITVWSTVQGLPEPAGEDDSAVARQALESLAERQRPLVGLVDGYVTPQAAIKLASECRALVSMRLHPALFAAGVGTPSALILSGQKVGVIGGTGLEARLADPYDPVAVTRAVQRAVTEGLSRSRSPVEVWRELVPLRERHEETRERLRELMMTIAPVPMIRPSRAGRRGTKP